MKTLQRFHTVQDQPYNARLMRAAKRLTTPKGSVVRATPLKKAWRRQAKRVRNTQSTTRDMRRFVAVFVAILAINTVISAIVVMLRRIVQEKQRADETPTAQTATDALVEESVAVLA